MKLFKQFKQYWWVFSIIILFAVLIGKSQIETTRESLKQQEIHRIQKVVEQKKHLLLNKAANKSLYVNKKDSLFGEYYIINADGSHQIKKIDGFDTNNLSYDKKVNDTMVDAWYKKEENKISETIQDAEKKFTSDQTAALETYNNLNTAEERIDMVQHNKTFNFSVLNKKNKSNDWFFFGTNIVSVYYNKKTDTKLVDEMISKLLKKLDQDQELYDKIQFLEVSKVNQFQLEDIQYEGKVTLVITDVKKEWRKVINIDDATRFIDALEFFKNPINKK